MKSTKLGRRTSPVEVTNVSKHGFWLLIGDQERFVPFAQFPWFREAPIGHLLNVELPSPHHVYWPDLDVDIAVECEESEEFIRNGIDDDVRTLLKLDIVNLGDVDQKLREEIRSEGIVVYEKA